MERVSQATQQLIEGGELQTPSHDDINKLFFEVVGGSKKNAVYGLGSYSKVLFDTSTPRLKGGPSSSSAKFAALEKENAEIKKEFQEFKDTFAERVKKEVEQSVQAIFANFRFPGPLMDPACFQTPATPHGFSSQDTQDPNANDE